MANTDRVVGCCGIPVADTAKAIALFVALRSALPDPGCSGKGLVGLTADCRPNPVDQVTRILFPDTAGPAAPSGRTGAATE